MGSNTRTLEELKDALAQGFDEVSLIELFQVSSFDLVEAFVELIENNFEFYNQKVDELEI